VFYRARRIGYRGADLGLLKFRKMYNGAVGQPLTIDDDERFTRIGRWLSRTKLDELPQLVNVLKGDMSLVGPRPEDPEIVSRHREAFEAVLQVRPGMTGLAQLAFASEGAVLDPEDPLRHYEARILPQKLALDRLYASTWNPMLDIRILAWTLLTTLLRMPIAVNRSSGRLTVRRRSQRHIPPVHPTVVSLPATGATASSMVATGAAQPSDSSTLTLAQ
jgi:lipopolysaccharide/colanic/teichoic acid biosynthesis glycosyltransferase